MSDVEGILYVGDSAELTMNVTNADAGTPYTPDTATLTIRDPSGAVTHPIVTITGNVCKGIVPLTLGGTWDYKWRIYGTTPDLRQGGLSGSFNVVRDAF